MARTMDVHTEYTVEIEVSLTGVYHPFQPTTQPSYASGGDPPEGDTVEDVDIVGARFERIERKLNRATMKMETVRRRFDLFRGVDLRDPNVARLLSNLVEALGEDAEEALRQEAVSA